ncbi:asparagine synthase (glutamine-hydrolyzing) [Actinoplanes digitatis]|uniref:asparagine synthase (glutamine-hydrolyzing) n=2 Tax=Actinoplanes digitatis TaxID=1868 RepID=A0A7W7MP80_9ACTN|nr:asparagine synthase (glutamine-hydrolyzing) [Actinoplanes digitatis]
MAASLDRRGPDSGGVWQDEYVTLIFRRLAVIDLAGGGQPMVAEEDGRVLAVLNYTGEVFNFAELRDDLRRRGHRFRTRSDTEVVLRAYLEWGAACAERLVGMFAFAVWDARTRELLLIRDRFGIYPLYYHRTPHGVIFGSEPKAVLAHPDVPAVVDLDGLREVLSFAPMPGRGVYRDVPEVEPGQIVRFGVGGMTATRYWRLTARPHTDDLPATVARVRELLEDSVAGQLVSDVPICVQLSGGLDSSVVAALAARALRERDGSTLRTFSIDFEGHVQRFRAGEMYGDPDAPYVAEMVRRLGSDHTEVVVGSGDLLDERVRAGVVRALDMPAPAGEMYTSLYLLSEHIRGHSTVTMTGDAADELFGGYRWFHEGWYRDRDAFPWLAASHRMEMLTGLLHRDLVADLGLEEHQRDHYHAALAEVPRLPGETGLDRRIREITYLNLTRYLRVILDRKDRMGMASALEGRVPFLDHRLVEYVFNVPWAMRSFDGREKSLLRAAARDLLPEAVLRRTKAPFPSTQDPAYARGLRARLAAILDDDRSPVRPLLDLRRAEAVLHTPDHGARSGVTRLSLDLAVQLDHWLTGNAVELVR